MVGPISGKDNKPSYLLAYGSNPCDNYWCPILHHSDQELSGLLLKNDHGGEEEEDENEKKSTSKSK